MPEKIGNSGIWLLGKFDIGKESFTFKEKIVYKEMEGYLAKGKF